MACPMPLRSVDPLSILPQAGKPLSLAAHLRHAVCPPATSLPLPAAAGEAARPSAVPPAPRPPAFAPFPREKRARRREKPDQANFAPAAMPRDQEITTPPSLRWRNLLSHEMRHQTDRAAKQSEGPAGGRLK